MVIEINRCVCVFIVRSSYEAVEISICNEPSVRSSLAKQLPLLSLVQLCYGIGSGYWWSSFVALRIIEKSAHTWIEPPVFFIYPNSAHNKYLIGEMTFISSRRFSSLSTNDSAAYDAARLGRETGFVEGLSASVASACAVS